MSEFKGAGRILLDLLTTGENPLPGDVAKRILTCVPMSLCHDVVSSEEMAMKAARVVKAGCGDWQDAAKFKQFSGLTSIALAYRLDALIFLAQENLRLMAEQNRREA